MEKYKIPEKTDKYVVMNMTNVQFKIENRSELGATILEDTKDISDYLVLNMGEVTNCSDFSSATIGILMGINNKLKKSNKKGIVFTHLDKKGRIYETLEVIGAFSTPPLFGVCNTTEDFKKKYIN